MVVDRRFKDKVTVRFIRREDGGLQAHCDAIPGFYLSGSEPKDVVHDVATTIEYLFKKNLDLDVEVFPLRYAVYQISERADVESEAIPDQRDYVIEKMAA
jgi:hypothetical protein